MRKLFFLAVVCFSVHSIVGQQDQFVGPPDETTHTAMKYNRFLFNPGFSFDKEAADSGDKNGYISFFGRVEKTGFEDAPANYRVAYNKTLKENMGIGAALFQRNIGVITNFGAVLNYAYNVEFTRDVNMTFGANVRYQRSGLKSELRTQSPIASDPILTDFENTSLIRVSPGVNVSYNEFDFGVAARNILNLQLGGDNQVYDSSVIVLHGMYSKPFRRRSPNTFRGMLYVEQETGGADIGYGFNGMVENNKYGFAQLGYNATFGISLGLGFNIAPYATIGYTVERGLGSADIFGLTHEFTLAYNFIEPQRRPKKKRKTKPSRKLPEREELSKAEKIAALKEAREEQQNKQDALAEIRAKAELLRTTEEQKIKDEAVASELIRIMNTQIANNDLEGAKATLIKIESNPYITENQKNSVITRFTEKEELAEDIEKETVRIAAETEDKNKARALLSRTSTLIANKDIESATAALERIQTNKYISDEEKRKISSSLQRIIKEKEAEDLAIAQEERSKKEAAELLRVTNTLIDAENIEEARVKASLVRQNKFIPDAEKQALLSRLERIALVKETEAADLAKAEEEKSRNAAAELVRVTNTLLDAENIEEAQAKANLIRQNAFISAEEKQKVLSRLERIVATKESEAVAEAETEAKKNSVLERVVVTDTSEQDRLAEEARLAAEAAARAEQDRIAEEARLAAEAAAKSGSRIV
ncbi:PorP/SprF family type IX secretion system membrane protein [Aquimarina agarivorans]|uniref:PorP/SprF family type IX secretion system membrane protein n=1 Tax=Aquimarina agarivorans TaxID=980584 RepID=UPI001300C162|nr:PorP/SprF family type IX secretion system membrane protein [Aquimarina agarivorans]